MNIGQAAQRSGVSTKMIRHYEAIGLLRPAARGENDYRQYGASDVHELAFIRRARRLGFSVEEIRELLALWRNGKRASSEVRKIAQAHLTDLERRLVEMQEIALVLRQLVAACDGSHRPSCPILSGLSGDQPLETPAERTNGRPQRVSSHRRRRSAPDVSG